MEEKNSNKDIFKNKIIKKYFKYSLFLISSSIIFAVFKFKDLPPEVPLFYSLPWGKKQLADKVFIFILPLSSILVLLLNLFLAKKIKEDFIIIKEILIIGAFLFSLILTITLLKIIFLVT